MNSCYLAIAPAAALLTVVASNLELAAIAASRKLTA
jgi:hypothetical protein